MTKYNFFKLALFFSTIFLVHSISNASQCPNAFVGKNNRCQSNCLEPKNLDQSPDKKKFAPVFPIYVEKYDSTGRMSRTRRFYLPALVQHDPHSVEDIKKTNLVDGILWLTKRSEWFAETAQIIEKTGKTLKGVRIENIHVRSILDFFGGFDQVQSVVDAFEIYNPQTNSRRTIRASNIQEVRLQTRFLLPEFPLQPARSKNWRPLGDFKNTDAPNFLGYRVRYTIISSLDPSEWPSKYNEREDGSYPNQDVDVYKLVEGIIVASTHGTLIVKTQNPKWNRNLSFHEWDGASTQSVETVEILVD